MSAKTIGYIIKRLLMAVLTIFVVASITFWFMRLIPGGPFVSEKSPNEVTQAAIAAKYGLDQPLFIQYLIYLARCFTFDFGPSMKQLGLSVNDIISAGMRFSFLMGLVAAGLAFGHRNLFRFHRRHQTRKRPRSDDYDRLDGFRGLPEFYHRHLLGLLLCP